MSADQPARESRERAMIRRLIEKLSWSVSLAEERHWGRGVREKELLEEARALLAIPDTASAIVEAARRFVDDKGQLMSCDSITFGSILEIKAALAIHDAAQRAGADRE